MPISALPDGTVRRLGSAVVITCPDLLLKELLDNAIDSGATSIDVLVSPNTVDKIEVRDNGSGIRPDELDLIGRPGHTSKLSSFDELATLGGRTLGFRGSALAGVGDLAAVSLTTRIPTEHVAIAVSLEKGGGIAAQRFVGAPVGTTVSVTNLYAHLPVRLQVAIHEAPKSLARMKILLQAYVLTRPWMRLRFTVLKTPSLSWSYSPTPKGDVKEAVMQLFGTELSSQCTFKTSSTENTEPSKTPDDDNPAPGPEAGPVFEALLPSPGADPRKIARGAFLSVDSRPVSSVRGTAKKLNSVFKRRLAEHLARAHSEEGPRDPFIRLNIRCPPGSYDVNVEPSKEDVIFKEEKDLVDQFETFLSLIYSTPPGPPPSTQLSTDVEVSAVDSASELTSRASDDALLPQSTVPLWRVDMSSGLDNASDDDTDQDAPGGQAGQQGTRRITVGDVGSPPENDGPDGRYGQSSNEGLNPWSIAKLASTNRRTTLRPDRVMRDLQRHEVEVQVLQWDGIEAGSAPPTQELTQRNRSVPQPEGNERLENPATGRGGLRAGFRDAPQSLPRLSTWAKNQHSQSRRRHGLQSPPTSSPHEYAPTGRGSKQRYPSHQAGVPGTLAQPRISFGGKSGRQQQQHSHRTSAVTSTQRAISPQLNRNTNAAKASRRDFVEASLAMQELVSPAGRGREEASPQTRPFLRRRLHGANDSSENSTDTRESGDPVEETSQTTLPTDDPRAHLIKQRQCTMDHPQRRPKRLKTEQLPLETIPREFQTRTLLLTVTATRAGLTQLFPSASQFDTWLIDGRLRDASQGETAPDDTANLVNSLLSRISHGVRTSG